MALSGASFLIKLSIFSDISKMITININKRNGIKECAKEFFDDIDVNDLHKMSINVEKPV